MKRQLWWMILFVGVLVFFVVRVINSKTPQDGKRQNTPLVKLETPRHDTIVYTLKYSGDVIATQQASIFSRVTGNLESVLVEMGESVKAGQLLAVIDSSELKQQALQTAAAFQNAKRSYERAADLFEQKLASKQEFDNTKTAFQIASTTDEAAKLRLGYARITAPFSGIITKRFLDAGAMVSANNSTLFTLMDVSGVKIVIRILEKDVATIKPGMRASVTVDAYPNRQFSGVVSRISEAVDVATRTMAVEVNVSNPERLLKPGMFSAITIVTGTNANGITLPTQAFTKTDAGYYVFVVANGVAKRKAVQVGRELSTAMEVLGGVSDSDSVVTVGAQFCRDGGNVNVQR